jgi:hypothetical protein
MYKLVFSSFLLFAFLSCSPKISKKGGLVEDDNPSLFLKKAVFTTEWMEGKCQLQMASEGSNVSGQGIIRVRKDSAIWVSVRKLGFEVGRALILKDSFFLGHPTFFFGTFYIMEEFYSSAKFCFNFLFSIIS